MPHNQKHDISAEQAVLGAIMFDNESILKIIDTLKPDDFYNTANQRIYATMLEMHRARKPIDVLLLNECLKNKKLLHKIGDSYYLTVLSEAAPTAASIVHYANIIKDKSYRRRAIEVSKHLAKAALDDANPIDDVLNRAERGFRSIMTANCKGYRQVNEGLHDVLKKLTDPKHEDNAIPSGLYGLDDLIKGFIPSNLYLLAGRPTMGKTALALNIARNVAVQGKRVLLFSLEMSRELLQERLICTEAGIGMREADKNRHTDKYTKSLIDATGKVYELPILIDDNCGITVDKLRVRALRAQLDFGVDFVIVDYIQLMNPVDKRMLREQQISEISRCLMSLAKELRVPILALSQLNRDCEKRVNKRPLASDLRESGSLEQDAYMVMLLYRGIVYRDKNAKENEAELIIAKHRNGGTGIININFDAETMKFGDLVKY